MLRGGKQDGGKEVWAKGRRSHEDKEDEGLGDSEKAIKSPPRLVVPPGSAMKGGGHPCHPPPPPHPGLSISQGSGGHLLDSSTYQSLQPKGSICSTALPALPASPSWHTAAARRCLARHQAHAASFHVCMAAASAAGF